MLEHIRPSVFYLFGGESQVTTPEDQAQILERTGAGIGGSGGAKHSQVKKTVLLECGHTVPMEDVTGSASLIGTRVGQSVQRWQKDELRVQQKWTNQSTREVLTAPAKWRPMLEETLKSEARKRGRRSSNIHVLALILVVSYCGFEDCVRYYFYPVLFSVNYTALIYLIQLY
jgi:hypothetical protein